MMNKRDMERLAKRVAKAIVACNPIAGQSLGADSVETDAVRARNLLRNGYVTPGDPWGWSGGGGLCTITLEQRGYDGDCIVPMDMYSMCDSHNALEVSCAVGDTLGDGLFVESINAAVSMVYRIGC